MLKVAARDERDSTTAVSAGILKGMTRRSRNWLLTASILFALFILKTVSGRNIEYVLEKHGWEKTLDQTLAELPNWVAAVAKWLPSGFWLGAFTVLILWGLLEGFYAWRRRGSETLTAPVTMKKRAIQKALDDLFAEGVRHKNKLIPPVGNYDDTDERAVLHEWQERALAKLDEAGISVPIMSRFRTFNEFDPSYRLAVGKGAEQNLLEAIWNERLRQLRVIIDSFDRPRP